MAGKFQDILGTLFSKFQLGLGGPNVKNESGDVAARNAADNAYAAVRAALVKIFGNDIELNAGATGAGADWKMTLRRPSSGMTHDLTIVMPSGDPAPGQALTVASFAGNVVTLEYTTIAAGTDKTVVDTTSIAFGSSSPVAMFTLPANAIVVDVTVVIDTAFNDAPSLSVGISGQTSKYLSSTQVDLTAAAGTSFSVSPNVAANGSTENLIATYAAGGATTGAARILVSYVIPS